MINYPVHILKDQPNPYFFHIDLLDILEYHKNHLDHLGDFNPRNSFTLETSKIPFAKTFTYRYTAREGGYGGLDWAHVYTAGDTTIRIVFV